LWFGKRWDLEMLSDKLSNACKKAVMESTKSVEELKTKLKAIVKREMVSLGFGVIYWDAENKLKIVENADGSVWVANTVFEADEKATELENQFGYECRTISFEGVNE
jgi:hypothetical protein